MRVVEFNQQSYHLNADESLLQCLLRHDVSYPHSCQAGICQSCLIKSKESAINPDWQTGLPETLKVQGYFLACLARPQTDLQVVAPNSDECEVDAHIFAITPLNHNVVQLKLIVENLADWIPGQYLNFINPEGVLRSYSIANIPVEDGFIELQIKVNTVGSMGNWLINKASSQTAVKIRGPFGRCFYHNPDQSSFDILLAGTGTGLAPLIAIIKSALHQNHSGKITLVHGGVTDDDIYCRDELQTLAKKYKSFVYDPCVLQSKGNFPVASVEKRTLTHLKDPAKTRVFVCGPNETIGKLKRQIFLAGVSSGAILSDVFL